MAIASGVSPGRRKFRDYPPLAAAALSSLLLLAILPSSLNLPQEQPAETLEFAPVPPEDEVVDNPPSGNFSSLGLAGGSTIGSEGAFDPPPDPGGAIAEGGRAKNPTTKRCVGDPPRQSEDPLSPPCVAHFEGENHGNTYNGVTREEVQVLFYVNCCIAYVGGTRGREQTPQDTYVDLGEPPEGDDEHAFVRALRLYQRHFNERYQTYGRFVRFHVYFRTNDAGPEARKAEAVENYQRIRPFAVLSYVSDNAEAYLEVMQRRGVIAFGGTSGDTGAFVGRSADYFTREPGLTWGYLASLEQYAAMYTSLLCEKIVPYRTSFSGNAGQNGQPRRLGLLWADDPKLPFLGVMKSLVHQRIEECGGQFVAEASFPTGGYATDSSNFDAGGQAIARFAEAGVSTVIWPGGMEAAFSKQAATANYFPEWILLGDRLHDTNGHGQLMDQEAWRRAWVVTPKTLQGRAEDEPCFQAAREADPNADRRDITSFACGFYNDIRQMFTGIQVAGPRLNPETMDRGFHAIPRKESSSTRVPACFYDPGDYTCVKDAQAMWWDPDGIAPGTGGAENRGCWRSAAGGRRFLAGGWPAGELYAFDSADDPCNNV